MSSVCRLLWVSFAACLRSRFHFAAIDLQERPTLRLRNLSRQGPFRPMVLQLMSGSVQPEQWAHDLRMAWRGELSARDFADMVQGCAVERTMALYRLWDRDVQVQFDEQKIMALGVLRRLLCGGLMTEERDARHRKQAAVPKCGLYCFAH